MSRRLKLSFLIHNIYGVGGTNRAVINLAEALAGRQHDVEIVSVFRRLDEPMMKIDSRVAVRALVDMRPDQPDRLDAAQWQRSSIVPAHEEFYNTYSQLTDARLSHYLKTSGRDAYFGTRPAINLAVAAWAPRTALRIAQEHQTHVSLPGSVRAAMAAAYGRIDTAVTVTDADAEAFATTTPVPGLRLEAIPNSVAAPTLGASTLDSPIIAAVGRLDSVKRYDLLIRAFARVRRSHPDWQLRIYGGGAESGNLRGLKNSLQLGDSVILMGRRGHIDEEWAKASLAVSTSERESFGMSIVEAMRCGVPVISTRAPVGPEEIITDDQDGLLVPVGDVDAIAESIADLIADPVRRASMARAALVSSRRYDPATVAGRYEALLFGAGRRSAARRTRTATVRSSLARRVAQTSLLVRGTGSSTVERHDADRLSAVALCEVDGRVVLRLRGALVGGVQHDVVQLHARSTKQVVNLRRQPTTTDQTYTVPTETLDEDRWNVYVHLGAGRRHRVRYEHADTRAVVRADLGMVGPVHRLLPYETKDGFLALRSWRRMAHAECSRVEVGSDSVVLSGRALWSGGPHTPVSVYAVRRSTDRRRVLGSVLATGTSGSFTAAFAVDELARVRLTRHDDWDLFAATASEVARIARLGDDIVERKSVFAYPEVSAHLETAHVEDFPTPRVIARPYLTVDSDVAIYVHERET